MAGGGASEAKRAYEKQWTWACDPASGLEDRQLFPMFKIEDAGGKLVRFQLNVIQERVLGVIEECEATRRPVRILILKARQMGVSTLSDSRLLVKILRHPGQKCLIMAHKETDTQELFQSKVLELWRQIPVNARPKADVESKSELEIRPGLTARGALRDRKRGGARSNIRALTAGSDRVGRSWTFQHLHGSEVAFWNRAEMVWGALSHTIHDLAGTSIILETTANGAGGLFYEMWRAAKEGTNGFTALFFPWFEFPEYQRPFSSREEEKAFVVSMDSEEVSLHQRFGLSLERMNWYRWVLGAKCNGDKLVRRQEYPSTPEEAFILSGTCRFNQEALAELKEKAPPVVVAGKIRPLHEGKGWHIRSDPMDAELFLYRPPVPGREYIMGADAGNGVNDGQPYSADGDFSAAVVRDRKTRQLMVRVHRRVDAVRFATIIGPLGRWYNNALLVLEKNGPGITTLKRLMRAGYPNIWMETRADDAFERSTERLGFATTKLSREDALECLAGEIARRRHEMSPEQVAECQNFVLKDNGRWEARRGWHDDEVLADAFLARVNSQIPFEPPEEAAKPEKKKTWIEEFHERVMARMATRPADEGADPLLGTEW